jgi:hypothetical protein
MNHDYNRQTIHQIFEHRDFPRMLATELGIHEKEYAYIDNNHGEPNEKQFRV